MMPTNPGRLFIELRATRRYSIIQINPLANPQMVCVEAVLSSQLRSPFKRLLETRFLFQKIRIYCALAGCPSVVGGRPVCLEPWSVVEGARGDGLRCFRNHRRTSLRLI
jgi:hypothetical protein